MTLEIALDADEDWDSSRSWQQIVREATEAAIAESAYPDLGRSDRPVEISVSLSGNDQVHELNAKWRGKDKPTNVLSFPMVDERDLGRANVAVGELLLGDIILARGVCEVEAADKGISWLSSTRPISSFTERFICSAMTTTARAKLPTWRSVRFGRWRASGIANPYEVTA